MGSRRVLGVVTALLAFAPTSAHADTMSIHGTVLDKGWTYVISADAESGSFGENATGTFDWQSFDENGVLREHWGGDVTCLQTRGRYASIGGHLTTYTEPQHDPDPGFWLSVDAELDRVSAPGFPAMSFVPTACNRFDTLWTLTTGAVDVRDDDPDTTPPVVTIANVVVDPATSPAGGYMSAAISAVDNLDGARPVTCDNAQGGLYPIGTTTLTCWADDLNGNRGFAQAQIHVKGAGEQITDLRTFLATLGLPNGTAKALDGRLSSAASSLAAGDTAGVCGSMARFVVDLQKLPPKKLSSSDLAKLNADATRIESVVPC